MQKAGEYLRSVREEKGYSMAEVSKNTKISSSVLRALEEGRLDNIDPIYLKGFLKIYCRFLGIGWQDFLKEHPVVFQVKHPSKSSDFARDKPKGSACLPDRQGLASNSQSHQPEGSGLASNSQSHKPPAMAQETNEPSEKPFPKQSFLASFIPENKKIILAGLSVIAALLLIVLIFRGCSSFLLKLKKPHTHKTVRTAKETPAVKTRPLPKNTQNAPAPTPKSLLWGPAQAITPSSKDSKTRDVTLVIRAQEDSFLKVKVDGRPVYQGSLHKGKAETWTAKDRIELFVGNAGGVALEVNGKILPSLGRRGQAIKSISINSEGLKIL